MLPLFLPPEPPILDAELVADEDMVAMDSPCKVTDVAAALAREDVVLLEGSTQGEAEPKFDLTFS